MKRRVVVTGLGAVTPIGNDVETFWNNLIAGKSGIGHITQFDTSESKVTIAGEVKDFDYTRYIDKKEGRRMDRVDQFAVTVAKQAVADAKLDLKTIEPTRCGVCVGTGIGGIHTFLEQSHIYFDSCILQFFKMTYFRFFGSYCYYFCSIFTCFRYFLYHFILWVS